MVEKIKETKDQVLKRLEQVINEKGVERMNVQEAGMLADVVKDLAEAEKSCWEAEYYMAVTEAMQDGSMGYDGMGYGNDSRGTQDMQHGYRRGYRGQPRDSMGRYSSRRGYGGMAYGHDDVMHEVRQMMDMADPQEKERLRMQLRQMTEM